MPGQEPRCNEKSAGTGCELQTIAGHAFYDMIFIMNHLEQFQMHATELISRARFYHNQPKTKTKKEVMVSGDSGAWVRL